MQPPLAHAVMIRVQPVTQELCIQLYCKAVVTALCSDAQHQQAACGVHDQEAEAAAAAAGGRRRGGRKRRLAPAQGRCARAEDRDEADFDSHDATGSEEGGGDRVGTKDGPAASAGRRVRRANPKYDS